MELNIRSSRPKVLVLLASYKGRQWLGEQISSILGQEDVDVAIRVADDNSPDGTQELLQREWGADPRVTLSFFDQSSGSAGANFRRLYREADVAGFDYVALADQDDIWHPGKLGAAIGSLSAHGAHGYSCAVTSFWPDGRETVVPQHATQRGADFLFEGAGQGCTFVMTAALFARVQQFCREHQALSEGLHYHDWLIYLLARAWNLPWHFDQTAWMRYRQHLGNEIGSRGSMNAITRRLELVRNGWYREQIIAAINVFKAIEVPGPLVLAFSELFGRPDSLARRFQMARFVLKHGRRRFSDRVVLLVSSGAGWI